MMRREYGSPTGTNVRPANKYAEAVTGVPMYCDDGNLRASCVRDKVIYLDAILDDAI